MSKRWIFVKKNGLQLWDPSLLGDSLKVWLDADYPSYYDSTSGGNLVSSNNAVVQRWEDRSGNGNHVTGSSTNIVLQTSAVNGKNALYSQTGGGNTLLSRGNTNLGRNINTLTCMVVVKNDGEISTRGPFAITDESGTGRKRMQAYYDNNQVEFNSVHLNTVTQNRTGVNAGYFSLANENATDTRNDTKMFLMTSRFTQQSARIYRNGNLLRDNAVSTWTESSSDTSTILTILGAVFESQTPNLIRSMKGYVMEFILTHDDIAFDEDKRTKLEGYIAHKWGLTDKLPGNHPYKIKLPLNV
jgi:hypothetical protein